MRLRHRAQRGVPRQRLGRAERLAAALARLGAGGVDLLQQLLPFRLPVALARAQQRPRQDDAPVAVGAADADVDELRIEHHLAEALAQRGHGRLRVARPGQADRLHIEHRIAGGVQRLLQVHPAAGRQRQALVGGQRRQLLGRLAGAALGLAAVGVDRLHQLRLLARSGSAGPQQHRNKTHDG
ncbi:hypothetical protein D3C76_1209970 [compost metagenome]